MRNDLRRDERGVSTVEYVIVLILVAILGIGTWKVFGGQIEYEVKQSTTQVNSLGATAP